MHSFYFLVFNYFNLKLNSITLMFWQITTSNDNWVAFHLLKLVPYLFPISKLLYYQLAFTSSKSSYTSDYVYEH